MQKMADLGVIPRVADGERATGFDDAVETFGNVGGLLKWDPRVYLPQIGGALPRVRREIPHRRLHQRIPFAVPHPNQSSDQQQILLLPLSLSLSLNKIKNPA